MKKEDNINKDLILREKLALQRTVLANQSTFLSFLRSSMYFLIAGLSIGNLLSVHKGEIIRIVLFAISVLLLIFGLLNYYRQDRKIRDSDRHVGNYKDEYLA
jgi:putative membrane protein